METYEVVWSGTMEKQMHDAQVRHAPSVEEHKGNRPAFPLVSDTRRKIRALSISATDGRERSSKRDSQQWRNKINPSKRARHRYSLGWACTQAEADAEREAIEHAHVDGLSLRAIAKLHPGTTPWSLRRHFAHIPALIEKVTAHEMQQNAETANLPARVEALILEAQQVLASAKMEKRWIAAIAALRENRHMLELLGRELSVD